VRALAIYEPTLFALIDAESQPPNEADGIRDAVASAVAHSSAEPRCRRRAIHRLLDGRRRLAARPNRAVHRSRRHRQCQGWANALFGEPTPLAAFETWTSRCC